MRKKRVFAPPLTTSQLVHGSSALMLPTFTHVPLTRSTRDQTVYSFPGGQEGGSIVGLEEDSPSYPRHVASQRR
jgi:hypothetical protein